MARGRLTDAQWNALDELRFSTTDVAVFRSATMVLMSKRRTLQAIDQRKISGVVRRPSTTCESDIASKASRGWCRANLPDAGPAATPEYRATLRRVIQTPPTILGYGFNVWSVARLNAHLQKETGLSFSEGRMRALLREEGFSFQRPKHTMRGKRDEVAYEKAERELKRLKKGRLPKLARRS